MQGQPQGPSANQDGRVQEHDYAQRSEMGSLSYLNAGNDDHLVRDYSVDGQQQAMADEQGAGEHYDMTTLHSTDSRTRLHHPQEGYQLPPGAGDGSVTHGRVPGGQPVVQQVQYPPPKATPAPPNPIRDHEHFQTVPLNDLAMPSSTSSSPPPNPHKVRGVLGMFANGSQSTQTTVNSEKEKPGRPRHPRNGSWDVLQNSEWDEYNPATANKERLRFADGDAGTNAFSRLYLWCLNQGIVMRWLVFIVPVLIVLWIPGIVDVAGVDNAKVWGTRLLWWSIWLTVVWVGFWVCKAFFMIFPHIYRQTVVTILPSAGRYTGVVANLGKYAKFILWAGINYIAYQPLIKTRNSADSSSQSHNIITIINALLLTILLCFVALGVEKLVIQLIALSFHQDAYADRIAEQKHQIKVLTILYTNSHDIPGRSDTLSDSASANTKASQMPKVAMRRALRGLKSVAQNTTTALGNVASEMTGSTALQTNSPQNKVITAISSANKSRLLARRLFYSFRTPGADHLTLADVARFFPSLEEAEGAFEIFDRDGNGDATRDEIDSTLLDIHRDRISLEASIRDLDGAVSRLDEILLAVVLVVCVVIFAALVVSNQTSTTSFVSGIGTYILSLSWLIGTTMQEILLSCIFVFVKHPYDVGDRVIIGDETLIVAKVELLSTAFKRASGHYIWWGNNQLSTKMIENVRRSGATSETFAFDVAFDTSFESLQALRAAMLRFVTQNNRDFQPIFDVIVSNFESQDKLSLKADIRFKQSAQQGAARVQRRNKWICQLKLELARLHIWGPAGAGNPSPAPAAPTRYTEVPWDEVREAEHAEAPPVFNTSTAVSQLTSHRRVDSTLDLLGEAESLPPTRANSPGPNAPFQQYSTSIAPAAMERLDSNGRRPINTVQQTGQRQYYSSSSGSHA